MSDLETLKQQVTQEIHKQYVSARLLLIHFDLIEDRSKQSPEYQDPRHFPFYYHLGKFIKPKKVLEIGFNLGMTSGSFFRSCRTVENFLGFQRDNEEYSPRLGIKNIKRVYSNKYGIYVGKLSDIGFCEQLKTRWDMILFNDTLKYEEYRLELELLWPYINDGGHLVLNGQRNTITSNATKDFSKIINREFVVVNTRNGTALFKK